MECLSSQLGLSFNSGRHASHKTHLTSLRSSKDMLPTSTARDKQLNYFRNGLWQLLLPPNKGPATAEPEVELGHALD